MSYHFCFSHSCILSLELNVPLKIINILFHGSGLLGSPLRIASPTQQNHRHDFWPWLGWKDYCSFPQTVNICGNPVDSFYPRETAVWEHQPGLMISVRESNVITWIWALSFPRKLTKQKQKMVKKNIKESKLMRHTIMIKLPS